MLPTKFQFIWLRGFRGEDFLKIGQSETRIACGGHVCMWIGKKMSNLYRRPSLDASYQVSVHMAEGFQRRRLKCEKLTEDRRRTPSDGKSSHCLWQGELKNPMLVFLHRNAQLIFLFI
jgi:hypothetical protein